jgi:hypothetical protein
MQLLSNGVIESRFISLQRDGLQMCHDSFRTLLPLIHFSSPQKSGLSARGTSASFPEYRWHARSQKWLYMQSAELRSETPYLQVSMCYILSRMAWS